MTNYGLILIFGIIAVGVSIVMCFLPFITAKFRPSDAKNSVYECGITPIGDSKQPFDVKFFIIAILFIIFDLEIILLLPFAISITGYSLTAFTSVMVFIAILGIGLLYEYRNKVLDW